MKTTKRILSLLLALALGLALALAVLAPMASAGAASFAPTIAKQDGLLSGLVNTLMDTDFSQFSWWEIVLSALYFPFGLIALPFVWGWMLLQGLLGFPVM